MASWEDKFYREWGRKLQPALPQAKYSLGTAGISVAPPPPPMRGRGGPLSAFISEAGGAGGALGGAATGAALGSVVPGIGNIFGGILGGIVGGFGGGTAGKLVENKIRDDEFRLGDALKEGAWSGAFGGIGPAWQGARGLQTLAKGAGGKGVGAGLKALSGVSDDATRAALGKTLSMGGKKAAQAALYGGGDLNTLQVAGRGMAGNASGVGIGAKAPGLDSLGAQSQDNILAALKKVGLNRANPEKTIRGLEPILKTKGASLADFYANSAKKFSAKQLSSATDDILKTIADDPSIELSKSALGQLERKLGLMVKKDTPKTMWEFQKAMGNAINFGKGVEAKLVDREAVARVIRSKTASLLDDAVKEAAGERNLYSTLRDAEKLMRTASKQADKSGLVARIGTSTPFRAGEAKLGGALEGIGDVTANPLVNNTVRIGRGMIPRGIVNQSMQPVDQTIQPMQQELTQPGVGLSGELGNQMSAALGGTTQPAPAPLSLQQALVQAQQLLGPDATIPQYMSAAKELIDQSESGGAGGVELDAVAKRQVANVETASQIVNQLEGLYNQAGGARGFGGYLTQLTAKTPLNSAQKSFSDQRGAYISRLVRALGEVGTLNEGDIQRAVALVPNYTDTPESAASKWNGLKQILDYTKQAVYRNSGGGGSSLEEALMNYAGGSPQEQYGY